MGPMFRHLLLRLCVLATALGLVIGSLSSSAQDTSKRGRKYKSPPPTARIEVTVLRDSSGKPIENAAVVFHPMEGEKDKGNMELKTNEEGKTVIDVLPIGDTVRMQVIAKGFQTYGQDYKIDKAEIAIEIKLKRPGEQYSIYKNHGQTASAGKDSDSGAPKEGNSPPDASSSPDKDAAKDKPADSTAQPPAPPSQPQPPQPN
jgi:hypothetical protein